jgi:hypothetical protein
MLWIVGHFVQTRAELLALLGKPIDTGWGDRFVRGASLGGRAQYPPREEVQKVMTDVSRRLHETLATLDDDRLRQPPAVAVPGADTLADGIAGFALHDCYHVGQMGYLRKALAGRILSPPGCGFGLLCQSKYEIDIALSREVAHANGGLH